MWLTGRLAPDFKTIADFRRDSGAGTCTACRRFVVLCRELNLFSQAIVAIDGSKFKAVNNRDRNFTAVKIDRFQEQIAQSIQRYLDTLETADRSQSVDMQAKTERLQEKIKKLRQRMRQRFFGGEQRRSAGHGEGTQCVTTLHDPIAFSRGLKAPRDQRALKPRVTNA